MLNDDQRLSRGDRRRDTKKRSGEKSLLQKWVRHAKEQNAILRVVSTYIISLFGLFSLYFIIDDTAMFTGFLKINAHATAFMVNLFGSNVSILGNEVFSDRYAIRIVDECTAIAPFIIFTAGVLAFPGLWKHKLIGLLFGFIALNVLNLARTTSLFYIGQAQPALMDVAHLMVWQGLMILASVGFWFIWISRSPHVQH
jgi:exosortase H (IPTLxxWG-CTERM-specific)